MPESAETGGSMKHPDRDLIYKAATTTPSSRQLAWQEMEFYAFIHYSPNAFTDREWGDGGEDPALFNPSAFDADQWVSVCRDAGMNGLILTTKHHDGFCLWPSRYTEHSVKSSPWKEGRGDIVGEVAQACRRGGIKFGIYLSPWDRHEPTYGDSPAYNAYFKNQLRELLTDYGEIFCAWFDGACGEGPNGKRQEYDWDGYYKVIRELQPNAVINVCGPDVRWCGNEAGHCRESEWSVVPVELRDREKIAGESQQEDDPSFALRVTSSDDDLGSRDRIRHTSELIWYPAEVNTSIRPGWFYHAREDDQVKSLEQLLDIYYGSVGGNATFLLNFPPDRRGLIHENDAARVRELGDVLRRTFATNLALGATVTANQVRRGGGDFSPTNVLDGKKDTCWTTDDWAEITTLEFALPETRTFNVAMLQEQITVGQRIEEFSLEVLEEDGWKEVVRSTVVGYKRLLRFGDVTARKVRLQILASRFCPTLSNFGLFRAP